MIAEFNIYQINVRDIEEHKDEMEKLLIDVTLANFSNPIREYTQEEVETLFANTYDGYIEIEDYEESVNNRIDTALEELFTKFNLDNRPTGKYARSLSTGDVIALKAVNQKETYYYRVDIIGYTEIHNDFSKCKKIRE